MSLRIGSLFSGVGGLDLAVEAFFGAVTVWHCEFDPEPSKVLAARWPGVPNLGDVTTVDWATVEPVDIVCGGSPCQDVSAAGRRAGMTDGTRSNLWVAMREAIAALKPTVVIWENVRGALSAYAYSEMESGPGLLGESYGPDRPALRAAGRVVGDLSDLGYDTGWVTVPASAVGAPHKRERVFVLAHARGVRLERAGRARDRGAGSADHHRFSHGRDGAPVALLPTPRALDHAQSMTAPANRRHVEAGFGNLPEVIGYHLLPTPSAGSFNESEPIEEWEERRARIKDANEGGMPHGQASEVRSDEALRSVRRGDGAQEIREPIGGSDSIPEQTDVLTELREQSRGRASRHTPMACAADPRAGGVCGVRDDGTIAHPSHRPEPCEQCTGEFGDIVRELPLETPLGRGSRVREAEVNWGEYGHSIRRWEAVLGRTAPAPTKPDGKNGNHRLNAEFVSWMMGYPAGWVTDIIPRNPAIRACGNGCVPQQAYAALDVLWERATEEVAA